MITQALLLIAADWFRIVVTPNEVPGPIPETCIPRFFGNFFRGRC